MTFVHPSTFKRPTEKSPLQNTYLATFNYKLRYVQVLKDIFPAHSLLTEELKTCLILKFLLMRAITQLKKIYMEREIL